MVKDELDIILESLTELEQKSEEKTNNEEKNTEDEEINSVLRIPKIKILGIGGAGNNTVTNLISAGIQRAEAIAVNTDARQLLISKAHRKILIGKEICRGYGAGSDPEIGEKAAEESKEKIEEILRGTDLLFITCGLGGGTGSGAAPYIAELARNMGILTVSVCTLPFAAEGRRKMKIAEQALKRLIKASNTTIIIPNDKLLQFASQATLLDAFRVIDDVLVKAVIGITDLVTRIGKVNVDFADVRKVLSVGGSAVIGIGEAEASGGNRAREALENALLNPLLDVDLRTAKAALLNITAGKDITLEETHWIIQTISSLLTENTNDDEEPLKWGAILDRKMNGKIRITIIMTGISLPYIDENGNLLYPVILRKSDIDERKEYLKSLGIDIFE